MFFWARAIKTIERPLRIQDEHCLQIDGNSLVRLCV